MPIWHVVATFGCRYVTKRHSLPERSKPLVTASRLLPRRHSYDSRLAHRSKTAPHARHVAPSGIDFGARYACAMTDDQLERYLELCKRMFERMQADGSWPWRDSQDSEGVVESKDSPENV